MESKDDTKKGGENEYSMWYFSLKFNSALNGKGTTGCDM